MRVINYKIRYCKKCLIKYQPTNSTQRFCVSCSLKTSPQRNSLYLKSWRKKNPEYETMRYWKTRERRLELKKIYYERADKNQMRIQSEIRRYGKPRKFFLKRAHNGCEVCGRSNTRLEIHHKDGQGRNCKKPNNNPANLVVLCSCCHSKTKAIFHKSTEHRQRISSALKSSWALRKAHQRIGSL